VPRAPEDPIKAESARIFHLKYTQAKSDPDYLAMAQKHREKYENAASSKPSKPKPSKPKPSKPKPSKPTSSIAKESI